jgi:hypothetical protein
MSDFKYFNFLLLDKEEYPDRKRQGEEVTFETASSAGVSDDPPVI